MSLPEGFHAAALWADYVYCAAPLIGVVFLVAVGGLILRMMRRAG